MNHLWTVGILISAYLILSRRARLESERKATEEDPVSNELPYIPDSRFLRRIHFRNDIRVQDDIQKKVTP